MISRFCIYIGKHNYSLQFLFNRNLITRDFWAVIIGFARTASRDGVREDAAREDAARADAVRSDATRADSDGADETRADAAGAYAARPEYFSSQLQFSKFCFIWPRGERIEWIENVWWKARLAVIFAGSSSAYQNLGRSRYLICLESIVHSTRSQPQLSQTKLSMSVFLYVYVGVTR